MKKVGSNMMSKFSKLKSKYNDIVKQTLASNEDIIIESFIEFYGGEYRKIIEQRYHEIDFIFYLNYHLLNSAVEGFIKTVENPGLYEDFLAFYDAKDEQESLLDKFLSKHNNLPKNYIGTTSETITGSDDIKTKLTYCFKKRHPNYFPFTPNIRILTFPILTISEYNFIKGLNYTITGQSYEYNESVLDKLLNDITTKEIVKIFKRRRGNLTKFCYGIPFDDSYNDNLYLIKGFYNLFKKEIKETLMTGDKSVLVKKVGSQNYDTLIALVKENYAHDPQDIELNKENCEALLTNLINQMQKDL